MFGGNNGSGQNGGIMLGGQPGQFRTQAAASVAGGNDNQNPPEVQGAVMARPDPVLTDDRNRGRQARPIPIVKVTGNCHRAKDGEFTRTKSTEMGRSARGARARPDDRAISL